ncbi:hypothetical protein FB451DRAFT_1549203 [Mycena latifolia]|nr:hypothetical protein FB451DRAFT_1549203 [Mycena latifolia]
MGLFIFLIFPETHPVLLQDTIIKLKALADIINKSIATIETAMKDHSTAYPSLAASFGPQSETGRNIPEVQTAGSNIVAAASQLISMVQPPPLTMAMTMIAYALQFHVPTALRIAIISHTVEILREAGTQLSPWLRATLLIFPDARGEVFVEAWGNRTRIDYGSCMELNFLSACKMWLERLGELQESDHMALVNGHTRVLAVSTYWLDPASSHGVWALDDYLFLPFLFGAAQLRGHKYIRPKAIHNAEVVEEYAKEYIYFVCVQFINSIKTASLR